MEAKAVIVHSSGDNGMSTAVHAAGTGKQVSVRKASE
jgi:hypothetical protein